MSKAIWIGGKSRGLRGRPGIVVVIPMPTGKFTMRMTLEDAENIAEKLLQAVRRMEERSHG